MESCFLSLFPLKLLNRARLIDRQTQPLTSRKAAATPFLVLYSKKTFSTDSKMDFDTPVAQSRLAVVGKSNRRTACRIAASIIGTGSQRTKKRP